MPVIEHATSTQIMENAPPSQEFGAVPSFGQYSQNLGTPSLVDVRAHFFKIFSKNLGRLSNFYSQALNFQKLTWKIWICKYQTILKMPW